MSYSRLGSVNISLGPFALPPGSPSSAPENTSILSKGQQQLLQIAPTLVQGALERGFGPPDVRSEQCKDYKYVVTYKPPPEVIPANVPFVVARRITWNPIKAGTDFIDRWIDSVVKNAGKKIIESDNLTRSQNPSLPATSPMFAGPMRLFLIGFKPMGTNVGYVFVGGISPREITAVKYRGILGSLANVRGMISLPPDAVTVLPAIAAVVPAGGEPGNIRLPSRLDVAWSEIRILPPGYSVNTAREVAISAATAAYEALRALISGHIFGGLAVTRSENVRVPGEKELVDALGPIEYAKSLPSLISTIGADAQSSVTTAESIAKTKEASEADSALQSLESSVSSHLDRLVTDLNSKKSKIVDASSQVTRVAEIAAALRSDDAKNSVASLVKQKIDSFASRSYFRELTENEKFVVKCIVENEAQKVVGSRVSDLLARAERVETIAGLLTPDRVAEIIAAYDAAIAAAQNEFGKALKKIANIRGQLSLDWWQRHYGPLPVWAWGAIGAVVLVGGAIVIKRSRSSSSSTGTTKS